MSDLTNAIQHGRTRRPGAIDASVLPNSNLLLNLVSYWKLDETSGLRMDSKGTNNLSTNGTTSSAAGKIGNALSVSTGTAAGLFVGGTLTPSGTSRSISLWCYVTDVSQNHGIASCANAPASNTPMWLIASRYSGGSTPFAVYHGGSYRAGTTVPLASTWYHLVYTYDGSTNAVGLYVNGAQEVAVTAADSASQTNLYIAASFNDYAGRIDEVGLWSRALSSVDAANLYNGGAGLVYPF